MHQIDTKPDDEGEVIELQNFDEYQGQDSSQVPDDTNQEDIVSQKYSQLNIEKTAESRSIGGGQIPEPVLDCIKSLTDINDA